MPLEISKPIDSQKKESRVLTIFSTEVNLLPENLTCRNQRWCFRVKRRPHSYISMWFIFCYWNEFTGAGVRLAKLPQNLSSIPFYGSKAKFTLAIENLVENSKPLDPVYYYQVMRPTDVPVSQHGNRITVLALFMVLYDFQYFRPSIYGARACMCGSALNRKSNLNAKCNKIKQYSSQRIETQPTKLLH